MNTRFHYLYRDASNYKRGKTIVLEGELSFEEIKRYLFEGDGFIASQVGLEDIQTTWARDGYDFPTADDHVFSEIGPGDVELTNDPPTVEITAEELRANFIATGGCWDVAGAMIRLGILEGT